MTGRKARLLDQVLVRSEPEAVANRLRRDGLWTVALVPFLTGNKSKSFPIIFMARNEPNDDEQKRFYRACLQISWLAKGVRRAIQSELGSSPVKHQRAIKGAEIMELRELVEAAEARMRKNGKRKRPRGGIKNAALDEVAEQKGLSSGAALKRQLTRYK
jgi:hypothetical protein